MRERGIKMGRPARILTKDKGCVWCSWFEKPIKVSGFSNRSERDKEQIWMVGKISSWEN